MELGASTSLGRLPGLDVVVPEAYVSRRHATVVRGPEGFEIVDGGSTHGTLVNGEPVQRKLLQPGDVIQLGSSDAPRLRFVLERSVLAPDMTSTDLLTSLRNLQVPGDTSSSGARQLGQLNFLLEAARQLNSGEGLTEIIRALLQLTLQLTKVERGFVFLRENGALRMTLGFNAVGEEIEEDSTVSRRAINRAIESESSFSVTDTLSDAETSEWRSIVVSQIRSIYCIPLRRHAVTDQDNRLLGLLYLDSQVSGGHLTELDNRLLDTIANEAAALLDNALLAAGELQARKAREELGIAADIQRGLMSVELPVLPYASLTANSVACLQIGGDFYDAVALDDCLCVAIADVSGKGVTAALVASTLQGIIHAQFLSRQSLPEIAALLNNFLCSRKTGKYVTCVLLRLQADGTMEYVNCGHIHPLVVRGSGVIRLEESNLVAGLISGASYTSARVRLQRHDRLLLMTDGITEAEDAGGNMFESQGVEALAPEAELAEILRAVAAHHHPAEAQDDCTMMELRFTGQPED